MFDIKRVKELLKNPEMSDDEAAKIRDYFPVLTDLIFDKWQEEKPAIKSGSKDADFSDKPKCAKI